MALRNPKRIAFNEWVGLDSFQDKEDIDPQVWFDSNHVLVNGKGQAEVLRSPKAFKNPTGGSGTIHGLTEFPRTSGNAIIVDRGTSSYYLLTILSTPFLLRTGQSGNPWTSLTLNDRLHRIDGSEFIQILPNISSIYRNGIDPPTTAPTIAYAAESSESSPVSESSDEGIAVSIQGSYAYRNSTTGHVSRPSPLSNVLGPSSGNNIVSFSVTASVQTGVDQIVFFLTVDGGEVPYLVIDCDDGDIHTETNATTTYELRLADIDRDTLTPEPLYNYAPPVTGSYMFEHKNRIILIVDGALRYSAFESCYVGRQEESWPQLNQLNLKNDRAVGGISTQIGALIFGQKDTHLLSGSLTDKTTGPNNTAAVSEKLEPMKWGIGIGYAQTAVSTPFGPIWVDQTKRVRNWNLSGFPAEIGQPLRTELDGMTGTMKARWFQHGKNGGYYVLTDGTKTLFIMVYLSAENGQLRFGFGKSTLAPSAIVSTTFEKERFFFATAVGGSVDAGQLWEILDPDLQGGGWNSDFGTSIYFSIVLGNTGNFGYFHSVQLEGNLSGLTLTTQKHDGSSSETITLEEEADTGGAVYGLVDREGRRIRMVFTFGTTDTSKRTVDGFQLFLQNKRRLI